eukprot:TRINITY_DN20757_c0_g1_i1.p1 TRINITY_DN20757_c0_g1~~TRINITY_DN20757_c0_g1_i1.p1  ORF type:complete len:635 (+),score=81.40 TRINITY_DN20757_c0_g1_i1:47-1951(+)
MPSSCLRLDFFSDGGTGAGQRGRRRCGARGGGRRLLAQPLIPSPAAVSAAPNTDSSSDSDAAQQSQRRATAAVGGELVQLPDCPVVLPQQQNDELWRRVLSTTERPRVAAILANAEADAPMRAGRAAPPASAPQRLRNTLGYMRRAVRVLVCSGQVAASARYRAACQSPALPDSAALDVVVRSPELYAELARWWNTLLGDGGAGADEAGARGLSQALYTGLLEALLEELVPCEGCDSDGTPVAGSPRPHFLSGRSGATWRQVADQDWRLDGQRGFVGLPAWCCGMVQLCQLWSPAPQSLQGCTKQWCSFLNALGTLVFARPALSCPQREPARAPVRIPPRSLYRRRRFKVRLGCFATAFDGPAVSAVSTRTAFPVRHTHYVSFPWCEEGDEPELVSPASSPRSPGPPRGPAAGGRLPNAWYAGNATELHTPASAMVSTAPMRLPGTAKLVISEAVSPSNRFLSGAAQHCVRRPPRSNVRQITAGSSPKAARGVHGNSAQVGSLPFPVTLVVVLPAVTGWSGRRVRRVVVRWPPRLCDVWLRLPQTLGMSTHRLEPLIGAHSDGDSDNATEAPPLPPPTLSTDLDLEALFTLADARQDGLPEEELKKRGRRCPRLQARRFAYRVRPRDPASTIFS